MQSAVLGVQSLFVNHKPRPHRERILGHLRRALGAGAAQRLCGESGAAFWD